MLSGRRLDLLDPSPLDIEIEDIAHGLSREARWNGQTAGEWAFTVAQHCLLVEDLVRRLRPRASPGWRLAALLHDAPEYVIGDLISPFKVAVGADYREFEAYLQRAIHIRFGLPATPAKELKELIKRADRAASYFEATKLAGFGTEEGAKIFGKPRRIKRVRIEPWPPERAKARFLDRFETLSQALRSQAPGSTRPRGPARPARRGELPFIG
jgi:hypothetical protein